MAENITNTNKNEGKVYTLYYAFFLIPLMITIVGVMFFFMFKVLTYESSSPVDYLTDVQYGAASKRWQAAYELSKLLANPDLVPLDDAFHKRMIAVYKHSIHDDPLVRAYLALAMGVTRDNFYSDILVDGLNDENRESRRAAIQAVGLIGAKNASKKLKEIIENSDFPDERLGATISMGLIGDPESIPLLKKLLEDEEPNIQWDAAVALAKMGDPSGAFIIESLMDRQYLNAFPQVDEAEKNKVILVAIEVSSLLKQDQFKTKLASLAKSDENLRIRDAAMKTLQSAYNKVI